MGGGCYAVTILQRYEQMMFSTKHRFRVDSFLDYLQR